MPIVVSGGEEVQTIKYPGSPTLPFLLTATVPLPATAEPRKLGIRRGVPATDWYATDVRLMARADGVDYYELAAWINSGSPSSPISVDSLDSLPWQFSQKFDPGGVPENWIPSIVNPDAWSMLLNEENAIVLQFQGPQGRTAYIPLCGGYDTENVMFQQRLQDSGYLRLGQVWRTLYKYKFIEGFGGVHIFASVMPTSEIQFELNWNNGSVEERRTQQEVSLGNLPNLFLDVYGRARQGDVIFSRVKVLLNIPGQTVPWTWTPQFTEDTCMRTATSALVKQASDTDTGAHHVLPVMFERPFRFAVHTTDVTPYVKRVLGMADWTKDLGGFAFVPGLGLPAAAPSGLDLDAYNTTCKSALGSVSGYPSGANYTPPSPFLPGMWVMYGGMTSGEGMWPYNLSAWFSSAQRSGWERALIEQMRMRTRTPGAIYYLKSGYPVVPQLHANGPNAPWRRGQDRRFIKTSGNVVHDFPFRFSDLVRRGNAHPGRIDEANYNPYSRTSIDDDDFYVAEIAGNLITPTPFPLTLVATELASGVGAPISLRITSAAAFSGSDTITVELVGTDEAGLPYTESITINGSGSGTQTRATVGEFSSLTSATVTNISGATATEKFRLGVIAGVPDHFGFDGITPIDDQHAGRFHCINRALFLGAGDPIAMLYILVDAQLARMRWWEREGTNRQLSENAQGTGGGMPEVRDFAWGCDMIACAWAILAALGPPTGAVDLFGNWIRVARTRFKTAQMSNKLFQAYNGGKEGKFIPYGTGEPLAGDRPNGGGELLHWMTAGREVAWLTPPILQLASLYGNPDPDLRAALRDSILGWRNHIWGIPPGKATNSAGQYTYMAMRPLGGPISTIYEDQGELPEFNSLGYALNPPSYPTFADDWWITSKALDTLVVSTPITLAHTAPSVATVPIPFTATITGGATFGPGKRIVLRVVGTDRLGAAQTIDYEIRGNSSATQVFAPSTRPKQWPSSYPGMYPFWKTITSVTPITIEGSLLGTEFIKCGTESIGVGLRGQSVGGNVTPTGTEVYQTAYALAILKILSDADAQHGTEIDQLIMWYTGQATMADAKTFMEAKAHTGGLYSGGEPCYLWQVLVWALRNE